MPPNATNPVSEFLREFRSSKGGAFTHTSICGPPGSYYVPPRSQADFMKIYVDSVRRGETELFMTERHTDIGPVLIDLDFRFAMSGGESNTASASASTTSTTAATAATAATAVEITRKYTVETLLDVVQAYVDILCDYVDATSTPHFDVFVLEKPGPVMAKTLIKDGFHIVIPEIVTTPSFQFMLRDQAIPGLKRALADLGLHNKIGDVVDEAVIEKNNWQMLGSRKPNCEPYRITHIYRFSVADKIRQELPIDVDDESAMTAMYVERLSIRNKLRQTRLRADKAEDFRVYEEKIQEAKLRVHFKNTILSKTRNARTNTTATDEDLQQAQALIELLSADRAESYNDWIRVGWCLRNIDHRLLGDWVAFSRRSSKFKENVCERHWDHMRNDGSCLGIGTLHMWARNDSPSEYGKIISEDLRTLIRESCNGSEYDVARVIQRKFAHRFAYDSENRRWYHFLDHRWRVTPDGMSLKLKLPTEVAAEYRQSLIHYGNSANTCEDAAQRNTLDELVSKLQGIVFKLKKASFQANIMTQCAMLFHVDKFEEKLDTNLSLVGFENGVMDLDAMEFRDGRPEDFLSLSTGINYLHLADQPEDMVEGVKTFVAQVLTNDGVRDYVMRLLSSFLHGAIRSERFHVWTGSGSNGKSALIALYQKAFGDYCCTLPIALLTQKRGSSNSATPELARARSKRFAVLQEPSDDTINTGLLKELTGGDKIYARALYSAGVEFKPQFKMVLTCNHLPVVPSDDGGTWRRIRVVRFESKFSDNPDPNNPNEFPADPKLHSKFDDWGSAFMSVLVDLYKKVVTTKEREPDEVLEATREYQRRNDTVADFADSCIVKNLDGAMLLDQAYADFRAWLKDEGIAERGSMRKADFVSLLEKNLGKCSIIKKAKGWRGFVLKSMIAGDDDEDNFIVGMTPAAGGAVLLPQTSGSGRGQGAAGAGQGPAGPAEEDF